MSSFKFGLRSRNELSTAHPQWSIIMEDVLALGVMDVAILCGHRNEADQMSAYHSGHSKKRWPNSIHNQLPSLAIDCAPWPIDWNDSLAFSRLAGMIDAVARVHKHSVRWGGDWDSDGESNDQSFMDIGHFELIL